MLAYGTCVGPRGQWNTVARPSLEPWLGPGDVVLTREGQPSIFVAYNSIAAEAARHPDLQALVLMHDDVELRSDPRDLVALLGDDVGVVGVIGSSGSPSIAWWHGVDKHGRVEDSRQEYDHGGGVHDVDVVDGMFIVLSPWVVRNLRWDERYRGFHGYEADICSKVKATGRRVLVGELNLIHHSKGDRGDRFAWRLNNIRWQQKWRATGWQRVRLGLRFVRVRAHDLLARTR